MKHLENTMLIFAGVLLLAGACNLIDADEFQPGEYEVIAPLVKADVALEDLADFMDVRFSTRVAPADVNLSEGTHNGVPPFGPLNDIFLADFTLSEYFAIIDASEVVFSMEVENQFPVPIGAGTEVVFVNPVRGIEVHSYVLEEDIMPGETRPVDLELEELIFESELQMILRNFQSPGSSDEVTITSDDFVEFRLNYFDFILNAVEVKPNIQYSFEDTARFRSNDDNGASEDESDETVEGDLIIHLDNYLPMDLEFQLYFLDEDKALIDSLFSEKQMEVAPAELDAATGEVLTEIQRRSTVPYSEERRERIQESAFVIAFFRVGSHHLSEPTRITSDHQAMTIQLVGDLTYNTN